MEVENQIDNKVPFTLHLPETNHLPETKNLQFEIPVLPESEEDLDIQLLDILQDVYYVTHLEELSMKNDEIKKDDLNKRDDYWDNIRVYWGRLFDYVKTNYLHIRNTVSSTEEEILFRKKGHNYSNYIYRMEEPYSSRYEVYHIFSPFFSKVDIRKHFGSCTKIVCNATNFHHFWNEGVQKLAMTTQKIQDNNYINEVRRIIKKIIAGKVYRQFRKKYLRDDGGCFLKATIRYNNQQCNRDVLCFSGLSQPNKQIQGAIDKILKSGVFHRPYLVQVSDDIRYYVPNGYVTYGEAKVSGIKYNHRMFSCCERKTFADYNWVNCISYNMIVKYKPCELCSEPVNKHRSKYEGHISYGKERPLKKSYIQDFNKTAFNIIQTKNHKP